MNASPSYRARLLAGLMIAGSLVLGGTVAPATSATAATSDGGVAWTVQTGDNDNGTARANFAYEADPGAVIQDSMVVVNTGTIALPLSVYAADAFTAPSGEIDVLVDGTPSVDSGSWVSVSPATLELAPGQQAEVTFSITVPADARPGDHAAGIVTSLVTQDASQSLSVDRRLGTRVNIRVAGELVPAAAVSGLTTDYAPSWNPFAPGTLTIAYALENSGNTRLTGQERVDTSGPVGLWSTATPAAQLSEVIPGSVIDVRSAFPVMSIGWLEGSVTVVPEGVGLGAGSAQPITIPFSTPAVPWSLYVLLLLAAGAVLTVVVIVRRRERRARGEEGERR